MSQNSSSIAGNRRGLTRALFGSLVLAAAAMTVQPSLAHGDRHRGGEGPGHHGMMFEGGGQHRHMGRMLDHVDATDAQRTAIRQIAEAAAEKGKPLREQQRALRQEMRTLMNSPNAVDRGAAENLRLRMVALHDQASKLRMDAMLDMADQLTPEQRAKISEMIAKRGERFRERMHQRRGDGAPKS